MPAQVPQATFIPIPPNLNVDQLVESADSFTYATRITLDTVLGHGLDAFKKLIDYHVIQGGKPLVVEGFAGLLPAHMFSASWLNENAGNKVETARDLTKQENLPISISHYLKNMPKLTNNFKKENYDDQKHQRLYLKDIDCPDAWHHYLRDILPAQVFYLNETTGAVDGPGAVDESHGLFGSVSKGKGVAPAGDLMSSLPSEMRAENLMCYIGHEGTYTPAHREMCATLGQNIMVETSGDGLDPWGKQEKPGSSLWFMTETKDRHLVAEYWMSILGHDIEVESHFAQINAWKHAPFTTYVVDQRVGDFILIPPLAPHQVWNRGTRTMKVAWNRTTVETLEMALDEALPRARMVCRDEQYKCKAIVYFTLMKYSDLLDRIDSGREDWSNAALQRIRADSKIGYLRRDFRRLFRLYTDIILSEMFSPDLPKQKNVQYLPYDSNVTCAYCRCNIFNRFLTCPSCVNELENGEEDAYDVCMECYAMGRSCGCISNLKWVEQFQWKDLVNRYEQWRMQIMHMDGGTQDSSPFPLDEARSRRGKKTLAEVCQEQLKIRPWRDINQPAPTRLEEQGREEDDPDEEIDVDDYGRRKTKKKRRSGRSNRENINCHICKHRELNWKLARCSCGTAYCYGVLFRAFDLMPLDIMENPQWKCPRCLKICSCAQCRRVTGTTPYEPHGTLVGHDTKRVADPRSVESLVDFSRSNLNWIHKLGGDVEDELYETVRLRRFKEEADREKAKIDTEPILDDDRIIPQRGSTYDTMMSDADNELESIRRAQFQVDPALMSRMNVPRMSSAPEPGPARMQSYDDNNSTASDPRLRNRSPSIDPRLRNRGESSDPRLRNRSPSTDPRLRNRSQSSGLSNVEQRHLALPSPSAMLGGAPPVEQGLSRGLQAPYNSRTGLGSSRVDEDVEMTELERNPNEFIANAGLTGLRSDVHMGYVPRQFAAPTANMTRTTIPNYQTPEHSNPWAMDTESSSTQQPGTRYRSTTTLETVRQRGPGQKRKRQEDSYRLESDLVAERMRIANREYESARTQKMLADAKKNDSFTMTQARLKHQQKIVKLPVQHDQLAQMQDDQQGEVEKQNDGSQIPRKSIFGGDGTSDELPDEINIVRSDVPSNIGTTQPSAVMEKQSNQAPPNIFGRRKRGRPSKAEVAARAAQGLAETKKASEVEKASPNGRNKEPWAMSSAGITQDSGPSTRSRNRRSLLSSNDQQQTIGNASPAKTIGISQRNLRSSLPKKSLLQEYEKEDDEDTTFELVDDNYVPIKASTTPSKKTNSVNGSSTKLNGKHSHIPNGKSPSAPESSDGHVKEHDNPYQAAKLRALRVAEGDVSAFDESEESPAEQDDINGIKPAISVHVNKKPRLTNTPKGDQEKRMLSKATLMQVEGVDNSGSLFSRPGMSGKRIKIVSQKNSNKIRRQTTGGAVGGL